MQETCKVNSLRDRIQFSDMYSSAKWTLPPEESVVKALRSQSLVPCSSLGGRKLLLTLHRMNKSILAEMNRVTKEGFLHLPVGVKVL